jgi:hypothetical protein
MKRQEIETALDNGLLWARMGNGNLWRLRRNGKTQLWKTRPDEFRIPVKAGLRSTGQITDASEIVADTSGEVSGRYIVERV